MSKKEEIQEITPEEVLAQYADGVEQPETQDEEVKEEKEA